MLNIHDRLVFYRADLAQYNVLIGDSGIKEKVSLFLLKYISAEGFYKKMLIAMKEQGGKKLTEKEKKHLRVQADDVARVLAYFHVPFEKELIERIFGSNDSNYMDCSIKKLRDRLVHRVNDNVIHAILERYDRMDGDIDSFFSLFAEKCA